MLSMEATTVFIAFEPAVMAAEALKDRLGILEQTLREAKDRRADDVAAIKSFFETITLGDLRWLQNGKEEPA